MWEKILSKRFDKIDINIINSLNKDGRISDQKLSNQLGISKTTVRIRRLKLQKYGAIKITGLLVLQKMNLSYADVLLKFYPKSHRDEIEKFIESCKEDEYVYEVTRYVGDHDLLLRFFDEDFYNLKNHYYDVLKDQKIIQESKLIPVVKSDKAWGQIINFDRAEENQDEE
jgi:DNA-binding Lrp family transcriptional regulator